MYPFREGSFAVRNAWYVAAFSKDVDRNLKEHWFLGEPVVLFRREDGRAAAVAGRCPHRHFPMASGRLVGDTLVCGYHGITFDADGRCVRIPVQEKIPSAFCIRTYPLVERWEWLWIWMGDPALADESLIPDHDAISLGTEAGPSIPMHHNLVKGRYQLLNDNLLDLSHLAYLHDTKIGTEGFATTRDEVTTGPGWVRSARLVRDAEASPAVRARHGDIRMDYLIDFTFHAPALHVGINRVTVAEGSGKEAGAMLNHSIVYHAITPATETRCHYFFAHTLLHPADPERQREAIGPIGQVIEEDIFATEEIERLIAGREGVRDLLTGADIAVSRGRQMLQAMMDAEAGAERPRRAAAG